MAKKEITPAAPRSELLVSKTWIQAVALVMVFGFFVLGLLAYRSYTAGPPVPAKVVGADGRVLFTGAEIMGGQGTFLKNGLMQYGSIYGHGAYLGPAYTADYLRRSALMVRDFYGGENSGRARVQTVKDFKTNRYDPQTQTLQFSAAQAAAFGNLEDYYGKFFGEPTTKFGLRPGAITDPQQIKELTAFFAWTAWTAAALRPGLNYSYTNNWPPEKLVDNHPTANTVVLAIFLLAVAATRHHTTTEIAVEIVAFAVMLALIVWFARGLKPKDRPAPTLIPLSPWHEGESPDPTQRPRPAP